MFIGKGIGKKIKLICMWICECIYVEKMKLMCICIRECIYLGKNKSNIRVDIWMYICGDYEINVYVYVYVNVYMLGK